MSECLPNKISNQLLQLGSSRRRYKGSNLIICIQKEKYNKKKVNYNVQRFYHLFSAAPQVARGFTSHNDASSRYACPEALQGQGGVCDARAGTGANADRSSTQLLQRRDDRVAAVRDGVNSWRPVGGETRGLMWGDGSMPTCKH